MCCGTCCLTDIELPNFQARLAGMDQDFCTRAMNGAWLLQSSEGAWGLRVELQSRVESNWRTHTAAKLCKALQSSEPSRKPHHVGAVRMHPEYLAAESLNVQTLYRFKPELFLDKRRLQWLLLLLLPLLHAWSHSLQLAPPM